MIFKTPRSCRRNREPRTRARPVTVRALAIHCQLAHVLFEHVVPKPAQADEPEVPVKVREWIGPALAPPDFVLGTQPPAQPHSGVVVERPVRFADGAYLEVVRPDSGGGTESS
jgi:hypothetical protein